MPETHRTTAIELLAEILSYRDRLIKTKSIPNISFNTFIENELKDRFFGALMLCRSAALPLMLKNDLVNGKPGYFLEGYQAELKQSVIEFQGLKFANQQIEHDKTQEIKGWTDPELLRYMKTWKTKLSPHWAGIIADLPDERRLPGEIKKLFAAVDSVLNPACEVKHEG